MNTRSEPIDAAAAIADYRRVRQVEGRLARERVFVATRPGSPDWEGVTPAMDLLARHVAWQDHCRVLVMPCGHGALAAWAAEGSPRLELMLRDTNLVAVEMASLTVARLGERATVQMGFGGSETFDAVLLLAPKGRALARHLLLAAVDALAPGGTLYLAGAKSVGIKSMLADAFFLLGPALRSAYGGGCRLGTFARPAALPELPAPFRQPGIAPGTWYTWQASVGGRSYGIASRPGVFSWQEVDPATRLLLEQLDAGAPRRIVDVGCGYGIIGMVLASRWPGAEVTLVDVDALACDCARETLRLNGVQNAQVVQGDLLRELPGAYDLIVANPPFHSGQAVSLMAAQVLVAESRERLCPGGRLVLVANRFLPYDHLLQAAFGHVRTVAATPQYRVLDAVAP
jgi:16S rRNA (guanine1207-N2)-methyltransferase